jgi:hypothetical protein
MVAGGYRPGHIDCAVVGEPEGEGGMVAVEKGGEMAESHILTWSIWRGQAIEDLELFQLQSVMVELEYKFNCLIDDYMPDGIPKHQIGPRQIDVTEPMMTVGEAIDRFDRIKQSWWHWFRWVKAEIESRGVTYRPTIGAYIPRGRWNSMDRFSGEGTVSGKL